MKMNKTIKLKCKDCGEELNVTEFYKDSSKKTGYALYCKACYGVRYPHPNNTTEEAQAVLDNPFVQSRQKLINEILALMVKKQHKRSTAVKHMGLSQSSHLYEVLSGERNPSYQMLNGFRKYGVSEESINDYIKQKVQVRTGRGKSVAQYTFNGLFLKRYATVKEAARKTGVMGSNIRTAARGKNKSAGSFLWKYTDGSFDMNLDVPGRCQHCGKTIGSEEKIIIGLTCLQEMKDKYAS